MTRDWSTAREFGRFLQRTLLLQEATPSDVTGDDVTFLLNVNEIQADAQPKKVTISGIGEAVKPYVISGSNTEIQYNANGTFGASSDLTWDDTAKELGVGGDINLDDGGTYATTLQLITPTANRTISFPDATGTVGLVGGSSGQLVYNNAGAYAGGPLYDSTAGTLGYSTGGTITQETSKSTGQLDQASLFLLPCSCCGTSFLPFLGFLLGDPNPDNEQCR